MISSLGYAYRKVGEYAPVLKAYDRALESAPNYVEAIVYRAGAYLGLGRLSEAKVAYETLFCATRNGRHNFWPLAEGGGRPRRQQIDSEIVAEFVRWMRPKKRPLAK